MRVGRFCVRYVRSTARDMLVGLVVGLRLLARHPVITFMLGVEIALLVAIARG